MRIPEYPDFAPLTADLKEEMHPRLALTPDGVSEFTFSGLYLFRERYGYKIARSGPNGALIVSGTQPADSHGGAHAGKKFFLTPCEAPDRAVVESLFAGHDYWKNISESVLSGARRILADIGIEAVEDRDNFDYLYERAELAELAGKKYHKKRNLVQQYLNLHAHEELPLTSELVPAALGILDEWREERGEGDYRAAREALELFDSLAMKGRLYFADGKPAGYCLGESLAKGRMFAVHFEKGLERYKGIYQFINKDFAASLPGFFTHINREQDLGDEGLRQAKTTYRPAGFVVKYRACPAGRE
ncbi:MAG: phosphatidylglycerol lysyltransferase domain-containing protein [Treponema sp.]|nr:phosphatidylglycerol lysyltransferase domain-containing protein [Treponema sp.]